MPNTEPVFPESPMVFPRLDVRIRPAHHAEGVSVIDGLYVATEHADALVAYAAKHECTVNELLDMAVRMYLVTRVDL